MPCGATTSQVDRYEVELARFFHAPHAVAAASGTAALHCGLNVLGIGIGDEVLVPAVAPMSSIAPVCYVGAVPVFVDCGPSGAGVDLEDLEAKITVRTRALLLVHQWGRTGDLCRIVELAGARGLRVIEDATHAVGTRIDEAYAGTFGDVGCFSTHDGNLLWSGEGGFLLTHDEGLAEQCRHLRSHGASTTERGRSLSAVGFSYRLAEPLAVIARTNLANLAEVLGERQRATELLTDLLRDVPGLTISAPDGPERWNGHSPLLRIGLERPREFSAYLSTTHGVANSIGSHRLTAADQAPAFVEHVRRRQPCLRARAVVDTTLAISLVENTTEDDLHQIAATVRGEAVRWNQ
ncbi:MULTISPECIES: DegT/DnrJ/EryC1/StrS aminotransferase family protein [unclassified Crossiella]|uniref:DegT/DnrJ/EryC1/StrS family aminotransferase n=1 Tax=unclassified Crossiella TaxID=2620835 RepID=UPI0020003888|nr:MULTISPECIES: DegT/DnrJ/EryC1/StrS family aminotransferase [unclassified Crossiella]MCK2237421.1 DegT/DnrJ/EryC1/StrS family aminotransferase [Crossiella sp. S99.2]MCK2251076.1 DegT/DnrJ/EryC1/StrS family aminotransferase [Crossiella sp. S99.1]